MLPAQRWRRGIYRSTGVLGIQGVTGCVGVEKPTWTSVRGAVGGLRKGEEVLKKQNRKVHLNKKAKTPRRASSSVPFPLAGSGGEGEFSTARSPSFPGCEDSFAPPRSEVLLRPHTSHPAVHPVVTLSTPHPTPPHPGYFRCYFLPPASLTADCRFLASLPQL